jgi:hypothetical protein
VQILSSRNEVSEAEVETWYRNPNSAPPVDSLFFGRRSNLGEEGAIVIGPSDAPEQRHSIALGMESDFKRPWMAAGSFLVG